MDVLELDAASNTGVDKVREAIIDTVALSSGRDRYKVFILDEVHMLSTPAFNALLKTIEEPPPHVVFILATTELHKVPLTISSRCQTFRFKPITEEEIAAHLQDWAGA
jgi:DNA polymerase-3 subunit gamma/tau